MRSSRFTSLAVLTVLGIYGMVGCESGETVRQDTKIRTRSDGTVIREEEKTVRESDGTIRTTETRKVDRPD